MLIIENEIIKASFKSVGAELQSLEKKEGNLEYIWQADPNYWSKSSPILFPIVGALKDNIFKYKNKEYRLPRHGFAREKEFIVENHSKSQITFLLTEDSETLKIFPFEFQLRICYELLENSLKVIYNVRNKGLDTLFFSIGGHPAFICPLDKSLTYEDYYLEFNQKEDLVRWPITKEGLIKNYSEPLEDKTNTLSLNKALFFGDALVFKGLQSEKITLKTKKNSSKLEFYFKKFPFLGIWAAKNADFVCLEPWCGIADSENSNHNIEDKEGIIKLSPNEVFNKEYEIKVF